MSTPLIFRDGLIKPYDKLPDDITPSTLEIFYATDRQPTDKIFLHPVFYGNDRSMSLYLGTATVRIGSDEMTWQEIEKFSLMRERVREVPIQLVGVKRLHEIGSASKSLEESLRKKTDAKDLFLARLNSRLSNSKIKTIFIFVPGFKVDFTYPVLVAAELWHYLGYPGAFIAYSWPSRQRLRDYFSDVETAAFTAQHFRMLLRYLAEKTDVESIHILSYSAGARIVSQALHELRLTAYKIPVPQIKEFLRIGEVIFAAPDIDTMLFTARYRDGFEDVADAITIYTNANDTALKWALRFFGWPRLGAPGELGPTPEDLQHLKDYGNTTLIDVAAAENVASGNGHGYFIKSPWVSTDLLLTLKHGSDPPKRGLRYNEVDAAWVFPESYPQKIRQVVEQIY
jgi:esterase/lipase superfamily enzyme